MRVELWQIPVLVTAALILLELLFGRLLSRWIVVVARRRIRTAALAALTVLVIAIGVVALGPTLADQLSSVAAAVATIAALMLTYRSYRSDHGTDPISGQAGTTSPDGSVDPR